MAAGRGRASACSARYVRGPDGPYRGAIRPGGTTAPGTKVRVRAAVGPATQELLDAGRVRRGLDHGLQHLLLRARWDADAIRDDLRGFVVEQLLDDKVVLVVDETGNAKKGIATVGMQRQYTGTAGRIENSQAAVYLACSIPRGHAAIDRELYVPRSWTLDEVRCRAAGIREEVTFVTKPALAIRMVDRTLDAGVRASGVAGDMAYGGNPQLRGA